MRASPPVDVALTRFGVWRAAMALVGTASAASTLAWWLSHEAPARAAVAAPSLITLAVTMVLTAWLMRMPPLHLCWDGVAWHLASTAPGALPAVTGDIAVVADLGAWMLLRFDASAGQARPPARWLALQRAGLEGQWHALRCAVYSPRPLAGEEPVPR